MHAEAKKRGLAEDREEENRRRQEAARATQSVFRMDFGKHKGLTLEEVNRKDPSYLGHLVAQHVPQARINLQQALRDTGRCDGLVANAGPVRRAAAERVLHRSSPADAPNEVRQLILIHQQEAQAVLAEAEEPCSQGAHARMFAEGVCAARTRACSQRGCARCVRRGGACGAGASGGGVRGARACARACSQRRCARARFRRGSAHGAPVRRVRRGATHDARVRVFAGVCARCGCGHAHVHRGCARCTRTRVFGGGVRTARTRVRRGGPVVAGLRGGSFTVVGLNTPCMGGDISTPWGPLLLVAGLSRDVLHWWQGK